VARPRAGDKRDYHTTRQRQSATGAAELHRPPGATYKFHTDKWAELYSKRINDMIAALKTKGVPIVWVGLPTIRGAKSAKARRSSGTTLSTICAVC